MAARGIGRSGIQIIQEWTLSENLANEMAKGEVEDALETCRLYDIPVTHQLCDCIVNGAESLLTIKFAQTISAQSLRSAEMVMPPQAQQQLENMASVRRYRIMPEIRVMAETARIEDDKKRIAMETERDKYGDTYHQYITQHGGVMNASQTGDVSAQQITVADFDKLQPALSEMRAFFKKQDSLDADEYAGFLAGAQKAAQEKDEGKMHGFLRQIPAKAWEIGQPLIGQALVHYLKAHGLL